MPTQPGRPCRTPSCPNDQKSKSGFCPDCERVYKRGLDKQRGTTAERGYGSRWQRARLGYLRKHPLCVQCQDRGQVTAATLVHHIVPHKGDRRLLWDRNNWQALCRECHEDVHSALPANLLK